MFQSKISKLLVSKCFEHQYGIRLLQNSTTTVLLSSDAEEDEETNQERKIHPDDVKMMTQMIQDRFDSASSKHEHIQVGLELVLNHVGMPSSRDRIVNSVLASSTIPQDFFDDEKNDHLKSSEDDEMMREIYYEYLSITPPIEFQLKKGESVQVSLSKHWNNVKRSIDLCMADLYYHKRRVETWYYLGTVLYDVIFVWCDQWSTIREYKDSDDVEEHKEENDLILSYGDLPRAFQYAERCFHICIEMKKRLSDIDVDLRQCYERVALISMYRETQLSSILSLNSSFSQSTNNNKSSATTIDNFKTAMNLAISTTKKSGDVDMTTVRVRVSRSIFTCSSVEINLDIIRFSPILLLLLLLQIHLRILLSDLLVDEENILQSLTERMKLLKEAVETSKGNQEYTLDALSALHTLRARTVLEHVKVCHIPS